MIRGAQTLALNLEVGVDDGDASLAMGSHTLGARAGLRRVVDPSEETG